MKRIHATALAAALIGTVPAWGQQPPAKAGGDANSMVLSKDGQQPGKQYKVLRTYKHPSGGMAYEVKDEATGEVMTVIENASPDQVKATLPPPKVETKDVVKGGTPLPAAGTPKSLSVNNDPILKPRDYSTDPRVMPKLGSDSSSANPQTQYTRPPVPAARRWFGGLRNDPQPKPAPAAPVGMNPMRGADPSGVIVATYHPDPMFRLIGSLRDDLLPSMREVAAMSLTRDFAGRPETVEALVYSARHDLAPSVRSCCLHCLTELRVQTPAYHEVLRTLAADRDEVVRAEARAVLAQMQQP